jgi:hypothetical protein
VTHRSTDRFVLPDFDEPKEAVCAPANALLRFSSVDNAVGSPLRSLLVVSE